MATKNKVYKRKCPNLNNNPNCSLVLEYKNSSHLNRANYNNSLCKSCSQFNKKRPGVSKRMKGENNPRYGKSNYDIWLEKYGKEKADKMKKEKDAKKKRVGSDNGMYGISVYDIWVKKYGREEADIREKERCSKIHKNHSYYWSGKQRIGMSGENSPTKRPEVRKKMRFSSLKNIENRAGQVIPNYNPSSIPILQEVAEKMNITDMRHAESPGGEFYLEELKYWADGYSKKTNTWFEYMEKAHKRQTKKDERRKQEIIEFLGCKFIEIWYDGTIVEYTI